MVLVPKMSGAGDAAAGIGWGVRSCVLVPMTAWVPPGAKEIGVPDTIIVPPGLRVCDWTTYRPCALGVMISFPTVSDGAFVTGGKLGVKA